MAPQINDPLTATPGHDAEYLAENNAGNILALVGTLGFVAVVIVALRLYVRIRMLKSVGMDDYLIVASMVLGVGMFVCFVGETYNGLGRHYDTITFTQQKTYLKWVFAHALCATLALCLVKISIAFFLMRLAPRKSWQWFLWGTIGFLICYTLASLGTLIFACIPVQASWDLSLLKTAKCFPPNTFIAIGMWNAVIGVATDFLFATIPIPIVMQLNLNLRSRVILAVVMSLGYIACAAATAKTVFLWNFTKDKDRTFYDWFFVLAAIELYLGILSASLPSLKRLATRFFDHARTVLSTTRRSRPSGTLSPAEHRRSRPGYQRQHSGAQQLELKAMDSTVVTDTVLSKAEDERRASIGAAGIQRPYSSQNTTRVVEEPETPDDAPSTVEVSSWYEESPLTTQLEAGKARAQVPLSELWLEKYQR